MGSHRVRHDWSDLAAAVWLITLSILPLRSIYVVTNGKISLFFMLLSCVLLSLWSHGLQHIRPPCPSPTPRAWPNSCPSSQWCHPTIASSVTTFSSCHQSFPPSRSFQMSQFFTSGGQTSEVSVSALVFPMNTQDWFPLGWTSLISLQSKGLSRVFSNT